MRSFSSASLNDVIAQLWWYTFLLDRMKAVEPTIDAVQRSHHVDSRLLCELDIRMRLPLKLLEPAV